MFDRVVNTENIRGFTENMSQKCYKPIIFVSGFISMMNEYITFLSTVF